MDIKLNQIKTDIKELQDDLKGGYYQDLGELLKDVNRINAKISENAVKGYCVNESGNCDEENCDCEPKEEISEHYNEKGQEV